MSEVANLPLFHRMSAAKWKAMQAENKTWDDVRAAYRQPKWCTYPDALAGMMGCWSLVGRMVKNEDYCARCDCYHGKKVATPNPEDTP